MKKIIVLVACSLVLVGTIGLSLWEQSSNEQTAQENATSIEFAGKNMEETATSTNLYMNYAEVEHGVEASEDATGESDGAIEDDREKQGFMRTSDGVIEDETPSGPDASKNNLVSSTKNTSNSSVGKRPSKTPTVTYQEVSDTTAKSGPKKSGKSKNRVVSNVSKSGENQANRVVENPEPLNYVEKIFANHGTAPVIGELLKKYQYPVEIGYSYDKNYDGKNEAGDFILNKVYDTEELNEDSTEESPLDEKKASGDAVVDSNKEDTLQTEASGDAVVEQTAGTEQDRVASGEDMNDQQLVSGDAVAKEQKKLEEYRKDIWKQIMQTKPVDVEIEKKVMKTTPVKKTDANESSDSKQTTELEQTTESFESEPNTETNQNKEDEAQSIDTEEIASGDEKKIPTESTEYENGESIEQDNDEPEAVTKDEEETITQATTTEAATSEQATASGDAVLSVETASEPVAEKEEVAGYYIIRGKMREGSDVYVSDIEIIPAGVDGFNKVRMGEDGEFKDSIVLTEDVVEREIKLYFTDGETITDATTFTYSKDTVTPSLRWMEEDYTLLQSVNRTIYCTKEDKLSVQVIDNEDDAEGDSSKTVERIQYLYGTKHAAVTDLENARLEQDKAENIFALPMNEDFYGRVLFTCHDRAGNVSDIQSQFVLVDHSAPVIQLSQDERCSAPYSLWVNVEEMGHIVSGIQTIQCVVDGNIYEVSESVVRETHTLDEGLEVSSKLTFPIELADVGIHAISIRVLDYAGNETIVEQSVEVTEPELVSIYMPRNFTIHIDPQQLAGREQIYSDNVELKNVSKFDVRVNIDNVVLNVNDEVSADGILKDCELYLIAPDTGEKIKLKKGENKNVYSYRLPVEAVGDLANIRFVGTTTEGSDRLWKGSDISLSLQVSFVKWDDVEE